MKSYLFVAIRSSGSEIKEAWETGLTEKEARKKFWESLTDWEKNVVESVDCIDETVASVPEVKSQNETIMRRPTEEEIVKAITDNVFIRGIEWDAYEHEFTERRSGLISKLYELFGLEYDIPKPEEETIPVTLATIKRKCGWSKFCDMTDTNKYLLETPAYINVGDNHIFNVKLSHAEQLGL